MRERDVVFTSARARLAGTLVLPDGAGPVPVVLSGVTHLLREEEGPAGLSTYKKQVERPMDPRVAALVIEFVQRQGKE